MATTETTFEPSHCERSLSAPDGGALRYHALKALPASVQRLPLSIRILLVSALRHRDGVQVLDSHIRALATWEPHAPRTAEVPFVVGRVLLQDFTGVPLLTDLAAMRSQAQRRGVDPRIIEPHVPVHLVVDHSVQTEFANVPDALRLNMEAEFARNRERYAFMKWGMQAFETFKVIPPGNGICHQINLEHLAQGVIAKEGWAYPETLVGTDSHTTMVGGIGVLGWGVGGIEAEAAMLGQPLYILMPDVVGVELRGTLQPGVTATDAVLLLTRTLRAARVVGTLVEFFGEGTAQLGATDRATIANMAPEYGATCGLFPVDEQTLHYYAQTGRRADQVELIRRYHVAQGLFGVPEADQIDYSAVVVIDLSAVRPALAGPKRPQDHVDLAGLRARFDEALVGDPRTGGYGKPAGQADPRHAVTAPPAGAPGLAQGFMIGHGDVLVAAITSCTHTSNPELLITAGLLARKAAQRGLRCRPWVKTLFTPGSRVVTTYLHAAGLAADLELLGFGVSAYGCGACAGNMGPLDPAIERVVLDQDLVCCAVLSGNRNFEARVHPSLRANFLASPPLVVALALAGTTRIDLSGEPLGHDGAGLPVMLADIWPSPAEVQALVPLAADPRRYQAVYGDLVRGQPLWDGIDSATGPVYDWPDSTYVCEPDFFGPAGAAGPILRARALAILGDSITTDHISPAGSIARHLPAGQYLMTRGVAPQDFNTYGTRRGHAEVMTRGTFANVRLKNRMLPPGADGSLQEGPFTVHQPTGEHTTIHEAALRYRAAGVPALVFAGEEYGSGSSRDWAAKGTRLLGVRAVIARSFERIHRSNLAGLGVLPLQFTGDDSAQSLGLDGSESFDLLGIDSGVQPHQPVTLVIHRTDGSSTRCTLQARLDTAVEAAHFRQGGVLAHVLGQLLAAPPAR